MSQPSPGPENPYARPSGAEPSRTPEGWAAPPPGAYAATPPPANVSAVVQVVLAGLALLPALGLTLPSLVLAIVALARHREAPRSSRRLTRIGWACFAAGLLLALGAWVWLGSLVGDLAPGSEDPFA